MDTRGGTGVRKAGSVARGETGVRSPRKMIIKIIKKVSWGARSGVFGGKKRKFGTGRSHFILKKVKTLVGVREARVLGLKMEKNRS